jgi:hypothetical protein
LRRDPAPAGKATVVEYGLIASKSSEILMGVIGQLQGLLDAIPFGSPVAIGAGAAALLYLLVRKR